MFNLTIYIHYIHYRRECQELFFSTLVFLLVAISLGSLCDLEWHIISCPLLCRAKIWRVLFHEPLDNGGHGLALGNAGRMKSPPGRVCDPDSYFACVRSRFQIISPHILSGTSKPLSERPQFRRPFFDVP